MYFFVLIGLHLNRIRAYLLYVKFSQGESNSLQGVILTHSQEQTVQCGLSTTEMTRPPQSIQL